MSVRIKWSLHMQTYHWEVSSGHSKKRLGREILGIASSAAPASRAPTITDLSVSLAMLRPKIFARMICKPKPGSTKTSILFPSLRVLKVCQHSPGRKEGRFRSSEYWCWNWYRWDENKNTPLWISLNGSYKYHTFLNHESGEAFILQNIVVYLSFKESRSTCGWKLVTWHWWSHILIT